MLEKTTKMKMENGGLISEVFYCEMCKRAWEDYWISTKKRVNKYEDFPTYGLKRKKCLDCKEVLTLA